MKFWNLFAILWLGSGIPLAAQDQPPVTQTPPADTPSSPAVLSNTGKPMVLPFQCTKDDTTAAGFSCSEEAPCQVYLDLNATAVLGNRYYIAGNIHSDAVTLYSVLLGSEDAGASWTEIHKRIRGAGLDHVQIFDSEVAWAGGEQLFPLPQDPFVLLTTDGGRTWRQESIFGEDADNHFGSVQEMYFSSKKEGGVVVDRSQGGDAGPFALYQSQDGGESWNPKESSSKALHLKGAPAPDADWRLRVDGNSKAFLLEHRQGDRWTSRASFAVNLGFCKLTPQ